MHPRLIELTGFLDAERAHLLAAASALPAAQWGTRPSPDRWSVAEILWHLHRTEANIAGLISTRVAAARAGAYEPETNESSVINSLDKIPITDRTRRLTSPRSITPTENQDAATVLPLLAASRETMRRALADSDGVALGAITHPHPAFGELDLYQWIVFVGHHERRHAEQITETIAALPTTQL